MSITLTDTPAGNSAKFPLLLLLILLLLLLLLLLLVRLLRLLSVALNDRHFNKSLWPLAFS